MLTPLNIPERAIVYELQRAASMADDYKLKHKSSTAPESKITKSGGNVHSARPDLKRTSNPWFGPTCAYCKRRGHLMSECWVFQKKERKIPTANPVATTTQLVSLTVSIS